MKLQSRVPLWVAGCVVAVFVGGLYLFAQKGITLPQTSVAVTQASSVAQASPTVKPSDSINPTPTPISSPTEAPVPSDWKTYRNAEYGFTFRYPHTWTDAGRDMRIKDYFTATGELSVLDVEVATSSGSLQRLASAQIRKNNCVEEDGPSLDRIIDNNENGILYVLYCSATSEDYLYIFKNSTGVVLRFSYHDDFEENWTIESKLKTFREIISTITFVS